MKIVENDLLKVRVCLGSEKEIRNLMEKDQVSVKDNTSFVVKATRDGVTTIYMIDQGKTLNRSWIWRMICSDVILNSEDLTEEQIDLAGFNLAQGLWEISLQLGLAVP